MNAALSIVLVARELVRSVYETYQEKAPWVSEPIYGPFQLSRWGKLKFKIWQKTDEILPEWIDYYGSWTFMVRTTRGQAYLDALTERIPDTLFNRWQRCSITVMSVFLLLWVVLSVIGVVVGIGATIDVLHDIATGGIDLWENGSVEYTAKEPSLETMLLNFAYLLIAIPIAILLVTVILLPILPGLLLHEFGHYAALRKEGVGVESYGLLFTGPLLGGAFVDPDYEELEQKDVETQFAALAGGILNNLIYGSILIGVSLVLFTNPITTILGGTATIYSQPLPAFFFLLGCFEYIMAFSNTVPMGPVDGGKFVQVAEEYYGETE